ncbi:FtsK/SpoIIIE domain-containing protein [Clostridium butyricum]|uniref:FtsK/SpoIIIE domain-containing protein n=1 Tax=Clostridium butyricum TaxID=1492 RepID=UPI00346654B0
MLLYQEIKEVCNNLGKEKESYKRNVISKFKKQWVHIMAYSGLYNKGCETYSLNNVMLTEYGIKCDIFIVPPLTFDKLNDTRYMLEENLNCSILFYHAKSSVWVNCKFIFNQNLKKEFIPIKQNNPYELYICNDFSGEPKFTDMRKYPHLLVTGTTRSGKSKLTDCILTNLVVNCSSKDVNLYLCQIAKYDLCLYEQLEHTRAFADTLDKTLIILQYIVEKEIPERSKVIKPYRQKAILDNISEYNELKSTKDKYPMILIVFDEMSSLFDKKGNNMEITRMKEKIEGYIQAITQYGASLSVYIISSVQRPTANLLPPFIKAMSNTLISLKQANSKSSEVATDDSKLAIGLPQRQLVYNLDEWEYGIVPLVNNKKIYEYIKPYIKPHKTIFDEIIVKPEGKSRKILNKSEEIAKNVKKIDNYIPYNEQNSSVKVIDMTKLPIKTQKPLKKGRREL